MQHFATVCYVLRLPRHQQEAGKLSQVSDKGILVGYSQDSKAYRVLLDTGKVVESRDVTFLPTTHQVPAAVGPSQSLIDFDVGGEDYEGYWILGTSQLQMGTCWMIKIQTSVER
jgi:hypothetical protein